MTSVSKCSSRLSTQFVTCFSFGEALLADKQYIEASSSQELGDVPSSKPGKVTGPPSVSACAPRDGRQID